MELRSRVTVLVKASPQPSKKHSETVCCAGIDSNGDWKRMFPIRFRRLSGEKSFKRWDIVEYRYSLPHDDKRKESCRVHEESISIRSRVKNSAEKTNLVERALVDSEAEATSRGASLALIRPRNPRFTWQKLSNAELDSDRQKFQQQAAQLSMLEEEISAYEPCPFRFKMSYDDDAGNHNKTCADWETSAAFFNLRQTMDTKSVLTYLEETYCQTYVEKGLVFALGNMKKRPQTWQLLGLFPVLPQTQPELFD